MYPLITLVVREPQKIKALVSLLQKQLLPPEQISVSEWAEKYRVLVSESSAEPGRWSNERTPYLREIMDCANNRLVKEIAIMSSSQVGKSECLNNIIGFFIDMEPCPILMLQPTIKLAEDYSKDRIAPMIRNCDRLKEKVAEPRSRDSNSTVLHKSFPGGHLTLSGSNSPASLASRPIRLLCVDEVDRMEVTSEGDPLSLAEKRTITFHNRLVIKCSTPTVKDLSKIERIFNRSDKRRFYVPCIHCGYEQVLKWGQVIWDKDKETGEHLTQTARYLCEKCQKAISDGERYRMIRKGKWIASEKFGGVAGFHLNELYSLWRKLSEVVRDFLDKKDNPETLRVWVNTSLGEPFAIRGKVPEWEKLYARQEKYQIGTVPRGGIFLTAGADVQEDRIHVEVVAWGRNFETWSVEYIVLYGDTTGQEVWAKLDEVVGKTWKTAAGPEIGLSRFAIDAGFNTAFVHGWVRHWPGSQVFPVIGRENQNCIVGTPYKMEISHGHKTKAGLKSYPIGVSFLKSELYGFLRQPAPSGPQEGYPFGFCHFPEYDEAYFLELTAEEQVKGRNRKGYPVLSWQKIRERNEALDCRVYARAAAAIFGIDRFGEEMWTRLETEFPGPIRKRQFAESGVERYQVSEAVWEGEE